MKKIIRTLVIAGALSFFGVQSSQAAIINGSFENGFNGWDTIGNNSIQPGAFLGSGPTDGTNQALSINSSGVPDFSLESFLGLTSGSLDGLGNGNATVGSAIKQTFTANAGDTISFDYNFLTTETTPSFFNDFSFVSLTSVEELADTNSSFVGFVTPIAQETGFTTFTQTIAASGTYTLGIGVVNSIDAINASGILVDNVRIASVPEPTTNILTLLVVSSCSLAFCRHQKRKQQLKTVTKA